MDRFCIGHSSPKTGQSDHLIPLPSIPTEFSAVNRRCINGRSVWIHLGEWVNRQNIMNNHYSTNLIPLTPIMTGVLWWTVKPCDNSPVTSTFSPKNFWYAAQSALRLSSRLTWSSRWLSCGRFSSGTGILDLQPHQSVYPRSESNNLPVRLLSPLIRSWVVRGKSGF